MICTSINERHIDQHLQRPVGRAKGARERRPKPLYSLNIAKLSPVMGDGHASKS